MEKITLTRKEAAEREQELKDLFHEFLDDNGLESYSFKNFLKAIGEDKIVYLN